MEKEKTRPTSERKWRPRTDRLRLNSTQRFLAIHDIDSSPRSPRSPRNPRRALSLSNKQNNDHDLLPQSPKPDHNIDKTSDRGNQAVSDIIQRPDETETSSKTSRSSYGNERDGFDSQLQSPGSGPTIVDPSTIHGLAEWQFNPEIRRAKEAPDSPHSPGSYRIKSPDSQLNSPGVDPVMSPHPQPPSPESEGVAVESSPTQDQDEEVFDAEAWLNSDSPLPRNYKAVFPKSPGAMSSDSSRPPTSGTDSLIVSPARTDEEQGSEEEGPSASMANAEIMKLFAEYQANSQLRLSFEESEAKDKRGARAATDRKRESFRDRDSDLSSMSSTDSGTSLLISHGQDIDESLIKSENPQDDIEKAKQEEEANQVALSLLDLHSANFDLRKTLEEKEAKFERDIRVAWTAPRPPPTTREQRLDRIALEKIESKEMFDEFGEQQRPVRTDPKMVSYETQVGIMINHARIKGILEDYPNMYNHANCAAAAAAKLQFPPLTARCCYYRGMASYQFGDLANAKDDFLASRGCAGLFGISSESIEQYIDRIDRANGPDPTSIESFPARKTEQTTTTRSTDVDNEDKPLQSTANDATTLVGGSPTSTEPAALAPSPVISPAEEERDATSQIQPFREADPLGRFPLDGGPQRGTDDIPNYQPQEEAISEQIRKDIFESKAQSLNNISEANPAGENLQERTTFPPPSMASTELALLGSATSQGTTRRVPRPYVAPIVTSLAKSNPVRQAPPQATRVSDSTDETHGDEMTAAIGGARDDATPVSDSADEVDEDEIMKAFGADRSGFIGAQGDDFTPSEIERGVWSREN